MFHPPAAMLRHSARAALPVAALIAGALVALPARADELVNERGVPLKELEIQDIKAGKIEFKRGGRVETRDLADVKGLRVDSLPMVGEVTDLILAKKHAEVARKAWDAMAKVPPKQLWLKSWLASERIKALKETKANPYEIVAAYCDLIELKCDGQFTVGLANNVVQPLIKPAAENDQRRIGQRLQAARAKVDAAAQVSVDNLFEELSQKIKEELAAKTAVVPNPGAGDPPAVVAFSKSLRSAASARAAEFQNILDFSGGKLKGDAAVAALLKDLKTKDTQPDMRLYALGRAYQELAVKEADAAKARRLWLEAGVCFARVVAQLGRNEASRPPAFGPSLAELALVQLRVGRADQAKELAQEADELVDQGADPSTFQRLADLKKELGI